MHRLTVIDKLDAELAEATSRQERRDIRRIYFRAVLQTISERSLDARIAAPRRQRENRKDDDPRVIVPFMPRWRTIADDELDEAYQMLAAYFGHHTTRKTRL